MAMRTNRRNRALVVALAIVAGGALDLVLPRPAQAIIGRPLTPMSYAGVARRTTRRAVYYGAATAPYVAAPYVAPPVVW
jgi:hypothetical protein